MNTETLSGHLGIVRKAKGQMEFNISGNVKDSKKGYYKNITDKRKTKENVNPLSTRWENW